MKYLHPLDESALRVFEESHHISLPADYRRILIGRGNGMIDAYGLSPLEAWCQPYDEEDIDRSLLQRDFDPSAKDKLAPGCLRICNAGCENYIVLVVTGDHRGTVWADSRANDWYIYPLETKSGEMMRFTEWIAVVESASKSHLALNDPRWNRREP